MSLILYEIDTRDIYIDFLVLIQGRDGILKLTLVED